jgi:hypothetical protein
VFYFARTYAPGVFRGATAGDSAGDVFKESQAYPFRFRVPFVFVCSHVFPIFYFLCTFLIYLFPYCYFIYVHVYMYILTVGLDYYLSEALHPSFEKTLKISWW